MRFSSSSWAIAAVAALSLSALTLLPAQAEDVKSADTLVKGLAPVKTRGFDPTAPTREAKQHELNTKLRDFKTRQITVEERTEVVKLIEESKSPNVDVQILFAFNSADILPEAKPSLDELGKALTDPKLTGGSLPDRRPYRRQGQRRVQSCAVAAPRRVGEGLPGRDLQGR